jgi:hypothetical protein
MTRLEKTGKYKFHSLYSSRKTGRERKAGRRNVRNAQKNLVEKLGGYLPTGRLTLNGKAVLK